MNKLKPHSQVPSKLCYCGFCAYGGGSCRENEFDLTEFECCHSCKWFEKHAPAFGYCRVGPPGAQRDRWGGESYTGFPQIEPGQICGRRKDIDE